MSLGDALLFVVAGLLVFAAYRGLKDGRLGFTHDPRLVTDRATSPLWYWGQLAIIICTIALLVFGAVHRTRIT